MLFHHRKSHRNGVRAIPKNVDHEIEDIKVVKRHLEDVNLDQIDRIGNGPEEERVIKSVEENGNDDDVMSEIVTAMVQIVGIEDEEMSVKGIHDVAQQRHRNGSRCWKWSGFRRWKC